MLSAAWLRQAPAAAGKEDRPARQAPPWRLTAALASALLAALLGGGGAPEPAGPAAGGPRGDAPDAGALSDHAFLRERVMEDHGWPGPRADGAIAEYLRFLQLLASAPRMELVASDDRIWCGTSTCWTRRTTRPTPSASSAASCTIAGRVPLRRGERHTRGLRAHEGGTGPVAGPGGSDGDGGSSNGTAQETGDANVARAHAGPASRTVLLVAAATAAWRW
ncbi:unnamed protein product [Prorocentrum cordatum]|uniref:Uncharacterized protein n=1 Tax=Prorocentrum cordatum TaxID=2364126 RepID=A0ABN9VBB8_9DINO|nr:unnamed protein product [Polarella glacialis]